MKKRTKVLATIGPASQSTETIIALIRAGVNVFRLNFSHGTHEYHSQVLSSIREAMQKTGLVVGVLQDICGPKIRVGKLAGDFHLKRGDRLEFVTGGVVGEKIEEGLYRLCINQDSILEKLACGDYIYLCDGGIRARVVEAGASVMTEIENSGLLSSGKGVNFPNTKLGIDILTPKDREDMRWGVRNDVDFMAISFVQSAEDMREARSVVASYGGKQQLFAKIEKFDAVEQIDAILAESDGLMVARGDLGIEVPYYDVPPIQKTLIRKANAASKPVITATQMLLSMTQNERATRAEISDVANAVLDGTDAVMLSEESAVGHNPVLAVETMVHTIRSAEKIYPYNKHKRFEHSDVMDMIHDSAVSLADNMGASGIFAMTASGQSAKKLARHRPGMPIYAITHDIRVSRLLSIVWGVVPAYMVERNSLGMMLSEVMRMGLERGIIDFDKSYVLTAGDPVGVPGTTNAIRILWRNEMEFFHQLSSSVRKQKRPAKREGETLF